MFDPMPCSHADRPMPSPRTHHRLGLTPWGAAAGLPADTESGLNKTEHIDQDR